MNISLDLKVRDGRNIVARCAMNKDCGGDPDSIVYVYLDLCHRLRIKLLGAGLVNNSHFDPRRIEGRKKLELAGIMVPFDMQTKSVEERLRAISHLKNLPREVKQ